MVNMTIRFKKISLPVVLTILSGVVFLSLLAVRMDWFQSAELPSAAAKSIISASETWMGIFQNTAQIGVSHRKMTPTPTGAVISETTVMRLNTMETVQEIRLQTHGEVNPDLSLTAFQAQIQSGMFKFVVSGRVQGSTLVVDANGRSMTFLLTSPIYLSAVLWDAAAGAELADNQSRTLSMFDPMSMSPQPVTLTALGMDRIDIMGKSHSARKIGMEFMGSRQTAWLDSEGHVLQEEGIMGITIRRISAEEGSDAALTSGEDITRLVSIPADQPMGDAEKLNRLILQITGVDVIDTERQQFAGGMLTIIKEDLSALSDRFFTEPADFLKPAALIQSDDPEIVKQLGEIVSEKDAPLVRVQRIKEWVFNHIQKRPVLSLSNALETLKNRVGDCNEHAVLFAAFARAAKIPTRIDTGLVYLRGRFYYHAWNSVFLGKWITVDALMNQMPADVTHITLSRGNPESQMEILGAIGKIGISIREQQ